MVRRNSPKRGQGNETSLSTRLKLSTAKLVVDRFKVSRGSDAEVANIAPAASVFTNGAETVAQLNDRVLRLATRIDYNGGSAAIMLYVSRRTVSLPYLSTTQAAERSGVSIRTIQRMIERGELPAELVGTQLLIPITDLDAVFERMAQVPKVGRAAPQLKLDYWTAFAELLDWQGFPQKVKPQSEQWMAFGIAANCRVAAHIRVNQGFIGVDLTLGSKAKQYYSDLEKQKPKIEEQIGRAVGEKNVGLEWLERPNNAESWVLVRKDSDVTNRLLWSAQHYWLSKRLRAFYETFKPRLQELQKK